MAKGLRLIYKIHEFLREHSDIGRDFVQKSSVQLLARMHWDRGRSPIRMLQQDVGSLSMAGRKAELRQRFDDLASFRGVKRLAPAPQIRTFFNATNSGRRRSLPSASKYN